MTPVRWLALAAIALFLALPASAAMVLPDLEENPLVPVLDEYYKVPETIQIITVAQNVSHPDDLLVTLFLAHASHKDPVTLNEWRKKSMSWQEIFEKLKLKPSVFFSSLQGVSVPARYQTYVYAQHQYDAWRKHPTAGITLYDKTIRELVGLDFMVQRFKMKPLDAMAAREHEPSYLHMASEKVAKD